MSFLGDIVTKLPFLYVESDVEYTFVQRVSLCTAIEKLDLCNYMQCATSGSQ